MITIVEMLFHIPGVVSGRALGLILIIGIFILGIYYMRRRKLPYIRRVAAIDAIDEALGRSTEMGRPILCSYGRGGFAYSVIAAMSVLGHVARIAAETDTRLLVPTGGSHTGYLTRELAVDIVRSQYQMAGKPEMFNMDDMPFLSGEQYSFTAGYIGMIVRERPGAVIMTGGHSSEAMNIAEMSNLVGALTITSGTYVSNMAALACASDYIMLVDEQPAAGAYLSRDPEQLATIRVIDIYKILSLVLIVVGLIILNATGSDFIRMLLAS